MATGTGSIGTGGSATGGGTGEALWNDAKETARVKVSEQQKAAASSLGEFAGALRKTAEQMKDGQSQTAARFAQTAASGLEQLSQSLRQRDLEGLLRDAESFARRQPMAFFGAALLAGFVGVRFLKSSKSSHEPSQPSQF